MASRLRRRLITAIVVLLAAGLLVLGYRPAPVLVDAETVSRGHLAITVEDEGRTRVMDRYTVSAPLASHARRITPEAGDEVTAGQVLVTLDALAVPPLDLRSIQETRARVAAAESALETAREELSAAEARARFARDELTRLQGLEARELVSPSDVERAAAEARQTEALARSAAFRLETARAQLEATRAALAYAGEQDPEASGVLELTAPVPGRVLHRHFESTRVVQAGDPILEIGDPSRLEVAVDVLSSDAVRIEPGMRVIFERWGEPNALEGRVRRVEPRGFTKISALGVEEQRVWVIADITSEPLLWQRLGDGYRVNARFVLWEADDVLRVPTSALFRHQGDWAAFRIVDDRAQLARVEIGRRGALHTQVRDGLREGDRVVVHPDREISEGVRLRVRGE